MKFEDFLKINAKDIEQKQQLLLKDFAKEVKKFTPTLSSLIKAFIEANAGGKKLRGALMILGYKIAGGKKNGEILRLAGAYEILHACILAHDDIIDKSPKRRGRHSLYQALGGDHYGISQAISLADYGFFLSIKIITGSNFPDKTKNKVIKKLSEVLVDTTIGQMLDIQRGDALTIMKLKTARYTIAGPLQIGAILAGADEGLIKRLEEFGENLGIAFQIRDDILDGEVQSVKQAKTQVLKYTAKAKRLIPEIVKDDKMVSLLEEMTSYLVYRTK